MCAFITGHLGSSGTADKYVNANVKNYDFFHVGLPGWYPTRSLDEWKKARALWEPWVFRSPDSQMTRPVIPHTQKEKKKKKGKN